MELIYEQLLKISLAMLLSGIVGWERQKLHKPAGLRTHILVCLGSALLTIMSVDFFITDSARILAAIVTGIGFIGAGTVMGQSETGIHGLTTAASLWVIAAVGMCVGIGWYLLAILTTIFTFLILFFGKFEHFN